MWGRFVALTARRRAFAEQYLRDFNATQAAIRAGYAERSAHVQGSRLLSNDNVQAYIQKRLEQLVMKQDEVLIRLAEQARAEYAEYLCDDGTVDLQKMIDDGKAHLIKSTKWNRQSNLVVEFHDAQSALQLIGKSLGLFKDGAGVNVEVNFDLDSWKRQREARRQELADVEDPDDLEPVEDDECAPPDG